MNKTILPGQTIGIIGGGQLGRMMALSAKAMGYKIAVLEPVSDSPCGQVADYEIVAPYNDLDAAKRLSEISDVITYEFENIDAKVLAYLENQAYLPQGSELLRVTQDRITEKLAITNAGVKVANYEVIKTIEDLTPALERIKLPAVLKTARGGYDGKGQLVFREEVNLDDAMLLLEYGPCVLEAWVPYEKELSVIVTRGVTGEISIFPVAENLHIDNILHQTIVPAQITSEVEQIAATIGIQLAEAFQLVGTLAIELFLTKEGEILVNELAPRPHNSGHYTMDACMTSQFEQHVRAVTGLPLAETTLLKPVVMVNLLGEHIDPLLAHIDRLGTAKLHLYGKKEAKQKRKMGHINFIAETVEEALIAKEDLGLWLVVGKELEEIK